MATRRPREKIVLELSYRLGAPADRVALERALQNAKRIDLRAQGEVEIAGRRFYKTVVAFYEEAAS